jgi:ElaB/YqjD/DUF883 family membrane-anchored ribosome-binding protein
MVEVSYLIDRPGPPSGLKSFINQRMVPPAIDAAGAVESAVYELGEQVRAQPVASLAVAAALGFVAGTLIFRLSRA